MLIINWKEAARDVAIWIMIGLGFVSLGFGLHHYMVWKNIPVRGWYHLAASLGWMGQCFIWWAWAYMYRWYEDKMEKLEKKLRKEKDFKA